MNFIDKGGSLNPDPMIYGNYVVIMTILMSIYVYVYICMSLSNRFIRDHDYFMIMCIFIYMYVCMSLFERVVRDHSCPGMFSYAGDGMKRILFYVESSEKSNPKNIQGQYHVDMN